MNYPFKVGDIITGKSSGKYLITNEKMIEAKVIGCCGDFMDIKILKHKKSNNVGVYFNVLNSKTYFKLVKPKGILI